MDNVAGMNWVLLYDQQRESEVLSLSSKSFITVVNIIKLGWHMRCMPVSRIYLPNRMRHNIMLPYFLQPDS